MRKLSEKDRRTARAVGLANVHLVWIPKRRKPVLKGVVKTRLAAILNQVAAEKGGLIRALEVAPDPVHVLVEHSRNTAIHEIAQAFKGRSSRLLRPEFPPLCKLPSLWPRSYFYDTTGAVTTARIEAYINDPHHGE